MTRTDGVVSVSGGDMRLLEIIRNNDTKDCYILTTPNGEEFLSRWKDIKVKKNYIIPYVLSGGILSNLLISVKSLLLYKSGANEYREGIVYSSCEHLYDILPALRFKLFNQCKWLAVYHWVEDYPWREKRGDTPWLPRYAYWLNRYLAGILIKVFADKILAVSDQTRDKLIEMKHIKAHKVKAVYCGVNYDEIRSIVERYQDEKGKAYDAVFMKRLNYGKGVMDLLRIWNKVVQLKPDAKLAIIGDGPEDALKQVRAYLATNGIENNVDLLGVVYDTETKFKIINSAKIFLLPTHEENWAIVIGEAMAAGVPVVVSRLKEIVPIWKDEVKWCEVGDIEQFADTVLELLNNPAKREEQSIQAMRFIPRYDWRSIALSELD